MKYRPVKFEVYIIKDDKPVGAGIWIEARDADATIWAITDGNQCLTRNMEWVIEPQPSSRSSDFIWNTRFTFAQASDLVDRYHDMGG